MLIQLCVRPSAHTSRNKLVSRAITALFEYLYLCTYLKLFFFLIYHAAAHNCTLSCGPIYLKVLFLLECFRLLPVWLFWDFFREFACIYTELTVFVCILSCGYWVNNNRTIEVKLNFVVLVQSVNSAVCEACPSAHTSRKRLVPRAVTALSAYLYFAYLSGTSLFCFFNLSCCRTCLHIELRPHLLDKHRFYWNVLGCCLFDCF